MKKMSALLFVLLSILNCSYAQSSFTAIVGGTVVNPDTSIANATILIENDKIAEVGFRDSVQIPGTARIIDVTGKWIIPGLIDSHVHFFQSGGLYTRPDVIDLTKYVPYEEEELVRINNRLDDTFARYLRSGITSVVDVGGPFWNFQVRKRAFNNPMAPRVAVAGPLISTYQPPALTTDDPPIIKVNTPAEARKLVRRQIEMETDLIKIWYIILPEQSPEDHLPIIQATIDESHKNNTPVAVHATQLATAKTAVRAGADILVHSVTDEEVDEEFISLLKEHDVIYTTTLVVFEGYPEVLSQQVELTDAEFEIANPYTVSSLFDLREIPEEDLPEQIANMIKDPEPATTDSTALKNLKILRDAGIIIAAGTDAGNIGTLHGPSIFREFELMSNAGLTPRQILTAATINGAKLMGRASELGSVERGKLADIVILNSNPLENIKNTSDIRLVIKDGVVHKPSQLLRKSPEDIVQQQVNAYNARDLEAFLDTYDSGIKLFEYPDSLTASGLQEMQQRYQKFFEDTPALHVEILNRITFGNYVIDKEKVTGLPDKQMIEAVAIYRVRDGKIDRVWFMPE